MLIVSVWWLVLAAVGLLFLLVASYTDIKRREVPDWLSYGLIFAGLGLRAIFSLEEGGGIFWDGVLGFLVCWGLAYLFYWANWWGGGDSKLLMGMGAVIGLGIGFEGGEISGFDFSLVWFFLGLLSLGGVISFLWSLVCGVRERGKLKKKFKSFLGSAKGLHYLAWLLSGGFLVLSLFYGDFWPTVILPIGFFYLFGWVKAVEEGCLVKRVGVEKLVEGDWLAKEVMVEGEEIMGKDKELEKGEIRKLMGLEGEGKIKKVWVKEGIPFVPSFLAAYSAMVVLDWLGKGAWIGWFWG